MERSSPTSQSRCSGTCVNTLRAELERTQAELRDASSALEDSHRLALLGTLTAGIAHEVSNILTPAMNYVELANSNPSDSDKAERAIQYCGVAIRRTNEITQAILGLANGAGNREFHVEPPSMDCCHVKGALDQACLCLAKDPLQLGVGWQVKVDPNAKAAIASIALEQVLLNLLLNAFAAVKDGGAVEVVARNEPGSRTGNRVIIEVNDTGAGIGEEDLDRIFEPFVSLGEAGHGLGLMVCHRLIERAGGTISVRSRVGEGTTFIIDLPEARQAWRQSA